MSKGTPSLGKRNRPKTHNRCPRCGKYSMHRRNKTCGACGYGKTAKRKD
ncbi:MAG: 50S ribosomal protein L37e [Candidatus Altiarchaeales archaeon]|nr:50S ribosomal protein L37e [Candidatus Altiarchaeales archaeon]